MNIVDKAEEFATRKHQGQMRDGDVREFIVHPALVAQIITQVTTDPEIIAAAWLHDTIEDTETTYDELVSEFGQRVADLVMEVTHEGAKGHHYFPRLQSRDGAILKFADRLSNISDMDSWDDTRKARYIERSRFWPLSADEV